MKSLVVAVTFALVSLSLPGQSAAKHPVAALVTVPGRIAPAPAPEVRPIAAAPESKTIPVTTAPAHRPLGIVSDWSQHHVLFPATNNPAKLARVQKDPRWTQSWYLHHRESWWPGSQRRRFRTTKTLQRDWNVSLGTVTFGPIIEGPNTDPGGGQTYPAKFSFDVTAPLTSANCTTDYVAIGLPATPTAGGQANIVGFNNLYSAANGLGFCAGTGPNVLFAYASGTGEVPASISLSLDGTQLAFVEDVTSGSSYFHVLTIGTSAGNEGTSAIAAVVPGTAGSNAVDTAVLLSPDGGTTDQSSTTEPFIEYTSNSAYVTTYSWASGGSGYLYKISPVFGGGTPQIVWSVPVSCGAPSSVPSSPVYDAVSNHVLFTDTGARLDYVTDSETTPTVVCGNQFTYDNTAANPPVVDTINQVVYIGLNDNGSDEIVKELSTTPAGGPEVAVGVGKTTYTGPYAVDFSNDYYNCDVYLGGTGGGSCSGTPLMYVAGTDAATGTVPTLYAAAFEIGEFEPDLTGSATSTALATDAADSSPVTEFYNATTSTDYLFVGVTNHCAATTLGGSNGCVMSLNINSGAPTVDADTTALPALGGTTGIVVDNDSTDSQASSIYYATQTGATLVKATQSGLN